MRLTWIISSIASLFPFAAFGELKKIGREEDRGRLVVYQIGVTPAAEPVPALRHRLTLREDELQPGNSAPYYYRAILSVAGTEKSIADEAGNAYHDWYQFDKIPLQELPLDRVGAVAEKWQSNVMANLKTATRRRTCDWGWNAEEIRGPDVIQFRLEEIQISRSLARGLMLQTRYALAQKRTDEAIELLRMNYRLGQDIGRERSLICSLVGIAISGVGNEQAIELIAQPGSPNLYWALAELPRPMVSIREALRTEMSLGLRAFPVIRDAETAEYSDQEWAHLWARGLIDFQNAIGSDATASSIESPTLAQMAVFGFSLMVYPGAKQRLIASSIGPDEVDKMPVGKVLAIDTLRQYRRIADELEKWLYIPYGVMRSRTVANPFQETGDSFFAEGYGYVLAQSLLPAISAARVAEQRLDWFTDAIQAVEAIRMHAAVVGQLPKSLDEIQVVPVPENPVTLQPFQYKLDGDTGVLELPFTDGLSGVAYRFEITLLPSKK